MGVMNRSDETADCRNTPPPPGPLPPDSNQVHSAEDHIGPLSGEPESEANRPKTDSPPRADSGNLLAGDEAGCSETDATLLTIDTPEQLGNTASTASPILVSLSSEVREFPSGMTSEELVHALRGEMLNHFHLKEFLGGGSMGVVFRALDTTLDRDVAVKVVASHRIRTEDLQRRYLVEAQSTARLDHPNIASVHFIGHDRGLPYIVFEYIDGTNLRNLIRDKGPLPLPEALGYTYQIAHALAHAWSREVVHRDIKPSNILISIEGQAKLVDMGLARLQQVDGENNDDLTTTGVTLGTFDYISPEQARDPRSADTRSDIYSLGCTFFFMLVGRPPFAEGNMLQKLLQHQGDRPPELQTIRHDIPDEVSTMMYRMLAKSPEDRYQNPADLVSELTSIMHAQGLELPHALGPLPVRPERRSKSLWRKFMPWVIPLLALLAMGLFLDHWRRSPEDGQHESLQLQLPETDSIDE
jgi:eukaryotic-like serine/threonine-protein kinase